jgi:hypothetical protein
LLPLFARERKESANRITCSSRHGANGGRDKTHAREQKA